MPLQILRQDITKMQVDAIVNAANTSLLGGGGVDGCIHRAAGKDLLEECKTLGGCATGDAKITKGYKLPAKYVIHAVGPQYKDGMHNEAELLKSCYEKSLALAKENRCQSVAFPLISSGVYGYPKAEALKIAMDVISAFLLENDMTVYITIFDKDSFKISEKLFADIEEYIDDNYVGEQLERYPENRRRDIQYSMSMAEKCIVAAPCPATEEETLNDIVSKLDESFSEMLLRKIDEKGMTDSQCYKKANIDRKLFSKIRSDVHYKPSKPTAIAFAIALELSLEETRDMLEKAGFALSHSNKFDVIIEYFIKNKNYDIIEINQALFAFDQNLLGS